MRQTGSLAVPRQAALYVALTAAFSLPLWIVLARHGLMYGGAAFVGLLMWCPGLAGMATAMITRGSLRGFGWRLPSARFAAAGYCIPVAYALAAYLFVWIAGLGAPDSLHYALVRHRAPIPGIVLTATLGVALDCAFAAGEEIGWRGFLVPLLASRYSAARAALVSGLIWSAWHYPLILFGDYNGGTPGWFSLGCFTAMVVGIAFIFAWARLASGSLWPCVLLHAAHNSWIQGVFTPLTADTGPTRWFIDEFGIMLPVTAGIAAYLVWQRWRLQGMALPAHASAAA
jgi:membrane protease YdiL (CAAX protease family)